MIINSVLVTRGGPQNDRPQMKHCFAWIVWGGFTAKIYFVDFIKNLLKT